MPSQIVNATIQAVVLSATSNILAQVLKSYRNDVCLSHAFTKLSYFGQWGLESIVNDSTQTPFSLNITPLIQFAIFTALNTPPNFLWQQFLEETFPGYTVKPAVVPASSTSTTSSEKTSPSSSENEKKSDDRKEIVPAKQLNIRNTAIKFLLDQTVGSLFNTVVFIAGIAALQGETGEVVLERVWNVSCASSISSEIPWY